MSDEPLHPRDVYDAQGLEGPETAFREAMERGRLHHAWLLTGPEGVGKATFAYRVARRLLGASAEPALGLLGSKVDDPVSRQVAARSHPDLMVLELATDDGKPRKVIPVDEARRLPEFFSQSPASSAYRVAIIDAVDDLNVNAANAVLKTLEEPPERGVLLLVSHAPGRLLPTIRSRCRRLGFSPLAEAQAAAILEERAGLAPEEAVRLARMSRGAPGLALRLAAAGALEVEAAALEILRGLPRTDDAALLALADKFRGAEGQQRFELLFARLAEQVHAMATSQALAGEGSGLDRWARAWEVLSRLPAEAEALNLDRADAFFTVMRELKAAAAA
ncbi:MAG TPA: DNA polymerase III subunit delta' [Caulobacteraceae bacterium]|nr:DNA polymerase III subunit delta' [Caulobacteraceae bacterium]